MNKQILQTAVPYQKILSGRFNKRNSANEKCNSKDIDMVMSVVNCSKQQAMEALERQNQDVVDAIIYLQFR